MAEPIGIQLNHPQFRLRLGVACHLGAIFIVKEIVVILRAEVQAGDRIKRNLELSVLFRHREIT
jgi:hypothetical protein